MRKMRGSVLAITVLFVLAFTMFGFTSIYFSGLHNQMTSKQIMSSQAFWLAESGISRALTNFSGSIPDTAPFNSDDDQEIAKEYDAKPDVYRYEVPPLLYQQPTPTEEYWIVDSSGFAGSSINPQKRNIEVKTLRTLINIDTIIKSSGPLGINGDTDIFGKIEDLAKVDGELFSELFGTTQAQMSTIYATHIQASDIDSATIQNIIWVDYSNSFVINTLNGSGFLIIDLRKNSGGFDTVTVAGNLIFNGIIWVIGNLDVHGTATVNGSIFIEGPVASIGTPNLNYNLNNIEQTLALIPTSPSNRYKLKVVEWKEI